MEEIRIEDGFFIIKASNDSSGIYRVNKPMSQDWVQFHFCLKGQGRFIFNEGNYVMDLPSEKSLLLYNPQTALPLHLEVHPNSWVLSLIISIRKFHSLFTSEAEYIPFLSPDYKEKKYYKQEDVSPAIAVVLSQMWNHHLHPSVSKLYSQAKAFELLSLVFNRTSESPADQCPFLVDEENVQKIRKAKEIIIDRMAEPPTLKELSQEIGLSLKKLKEGFKQIYGDSVYSFLFDYKMETARKMLESGKYNVNEVGLKVGYSTASHFISSFRKKYNTTPKKYLMSLANQAG